MTCATIRTGGGGRSESQREERAPLGVAICREGENGSYHAVVATGYNDSEERIIYNNPFPGPTKCGGDGIESKSLREIHHQPPGIGAKGQMTYFRHELSGRYPTERFSRPVEAGICDARANVCRRSISGRSAAPSFRTRSRREPRPLPARPRA